MQRGLAKPSVKHGKSFNNKHHTIFIGRLDTICGQYRKGVVALSILLTIVVMAKWRGK